MGAREQIYFEVGLGDKTMTKIIVIRAGRYDGVYQIDEIKSLSFHIMFYRLFHGVAKYIVSGKTFSSFSFE